MENKRLFELYYVILKTHAKVLPKQLRIIGDSYVREEFRQVIYTESSIKESEYLTFMGEWTAYIEKLLNNSYAQNLSKNEENLLSDDQKKCLQDLFFFLYLKHIIFLFFCI